MLHSQKFCHEFELCLYPFSIGFAVFCISESAVSTSFKADEHSTNQTVVS